MSLRPNASKQAENAADLNKQKISIESAMVDIGTLVTYICSAAVKRTFSLFGDTAKKIEKGGYFVALNA